jgi:hypothetical protein
VHGVALHRLTLRTEQAPTLLRLVSYEGIDGSSMYPGVDGVLMAMREREQWDDRQLSAPARGGPQGTDDTGDSRTLPRRR